MVGENRIALAPASRSDDHRRMMDRPSRHPTAGDPDRRLFLCGAAALVATAGQAAKPPVTATSRISWAGANGHVLHGYMAIPGKARGRQPAVLVIGEAGELPPAPDADARRLVEAIAAAGFVACTADHVTGLADLRASLTWLRSNRLATGRVALAAIGTAAETARRLLAADPGRVGALLLVGSDIAPGADIPSLAIPWQATDPRLPPNAAAFLKEHLA